MTMVNASAQPHGELGGDGAFQLSTLWRMFRGRVRLILGVFFVILAISVFVAVTAPTRFTASANLMVDPPKQALATIDDGTGQTASPDTGLVETEVNLLRAPELAQAVVDQLALDRDPEFNPALKRPSLFGLLRQKLSRLRHRNRVIDGKPVSPVVDALLSKMKADRVGTSYLIEISAKTSTAAKSAAIANAFAQLFMSADRDAKINASQIGGAFLNNQMGTLQKQAQDADTALQQYKIANNLMSAQGTTLTEQEISGLDQQLAQARAEQAEAEARLSTAKSQLAQGSNGQDVGEALSSPVIQQLRQKRAETSQTVADLEGRYGPLHPDLLKAKRELADIDGQIQAEIQRIISNLDAQADVARQRTASVEGSINTSRGSLAENNRAMVKLDELQRDADAARSLYDTFLSKYKETSAEAGLQRSDAHIASLATPPAGPSEPKRGIIIAFGILMGLTCGIGSALVAEQFYTGLNDVDSIEAGLGRAYLGSVPFLSSTLEPGDRSELGPADFVMAKPLSSFAESFRSLNAAISFSRPGIKPKVVAVTSSLPGEGKTTTSICLARISALSGQRTVVVDCDLRQRAVNRILNEVPTVGLIELLNGTASLEQVLLRDPSSGAMVLPVARAVTDPVRDVFGSVAMEKLIATLREQFDLIILDTAPVILVTDTRVITRLADAVLLLVLWRKTSRKLVKTSLRLLDAASTPVAGLALTQVDLRRAASVDPSDPTSYYRTYKKYYAHT